MRLSGFLFAVSVGWAAYSGLRWIVRWVSRFCWRASLTGGWLSVWQRKGKEKKRSQDAARLLPDFLEALAIALSGEGTFLPAWNAAASTLPPGEFHSHLLHVSVVINAGKPIDDVLTQWAHETRQPTAIAAAAFIKVSLQHGTPLARTLSEQSRLLREQMLMEVERDAQTAGFRLLIPITVCLLPPFFIILLAPLLIRLSQGALFHG